MAGDDALPDGVPPEEALTRYPSDPDLAAEFARLRSAGYSGTVAVTPLFGGPLGERQRKLNRACDLRSKLTSDLLRRLQAGELVAYGYDSRAPFDAPPVRMPAHRWRTLKLDVRNAVATDGDLRLSGLLITATKVTPVRRATAGAEQECREWLAGLMRTGPKQRPKARYRDQAQERFGVTARAFERAWGQAIAETGRQDWSKPGRKP